MQTDNSLFLTGVDFTPQIDRFKSFYSVTEDEEIKIAKRIVKSFEFPFVLILTCSRAEVISQGAPISKELLLRSLSLSPIKDKTLSYDCYENDEVVKHIFLLSSGVLSPLLGENLIRGQIY